MGFVEFLLGKYIERKTEFLKKEHEDKIKKIEFYLKSKNHSLRNDIANKNIEIRNLKREIKKLKFDISLLSEELSNNRNIINDILPISDKFKLCHNDEIFYVSDNEILIFKKINKQ